MQSGEKWHKASECEGLSKSDIACHYAMADSFSASDICRGFMNVMRPSQSSRTKGRKQQAINTCPLCFQDIVLGKQQLIVKADVYLLYFECHDVHL